MPEEYGSLKLKVPKAKGDGADAPQAFKDLADSITKPPTGGTGKIAIVQSTGAVAYQAIKGDVTLAEDGTVTIGKEKVTGEKLAPGSVLPARVGALSFQSAKEELSAPVRFVEEISSGGAVTVKKILANASTIDGQTVTFINGGSSTITFKGGEGENTLRMSSTEFALGKFDSITFVYYAAVKQWVEIARTNIL